MGVYALNIKRYCKRNPIECIKWLFHNPAKIKQYCSNYPRKCNVIFNRLIGYCQANTIKCKNVCYNYYEQCEQSINWIENNYPGAYAKICDAFPNFEFC